VVPSEQEVTWYQVITVNSGYSMTKLMFFQDSYQFVEDYNLMGLTLNSISITRAPYITLEDCDKSGKSGISYGYLKEYTNDIAKKHNFTYELHSQVDGDWGYLPKSDPYNRSGKWGCLLGKIVNAKYDMSLSDWWWLIERYKLMSFVTINSFNDLLVWNPTSLDIDFGLYL
jgi:hypothetical protein